MQRKLKLRDHAEVPAATPKGPEQIRMLLGGHPQDPAVGGHELVGRYVVAGQPEPPGQPAHPTAEGEPTDAGV